MDDSIQMANSIHRYYEPTSQSNSLPAPHGPLARVIPSAAIEYANREVQAVLDEAKSRKRGPYRKYSPKERAEIGKFAFENSVLAANILQSIQAGKLVLNSVAQQIDGNDDTEDDDYSSKDDGDTSSDFDDMYEHP